MTIRLFRNWYKCDWGHPLIQWTTQADHAINAPCPTCNLLFAPWASEDMTTAKFKEDNGIVDLPPPPQLDLFK